MSWDWRVRCVNWVSTWIVGAVAAVRTEEDLFGEYSYGRWEEEEEVSGSLLGVFQIAPFILNLVSLTPDKAPIQPANYLLLLLWLHYWDLRDPIQIRISSSLRRRLGLTELRVVRAEKGGSCIVTKSLIAASEHGQLHGDVTFHITIPRDLSINGKTVIQQKP